MLKNKFTLDNEVKIIYGITNLINVLISVILFKLKELHIISDFLSQWSEYWKALNDVGHFLKLHPGLVDIFVFILRVLYFYDKGIFSYCELGTLCENGVMSWLRHLFLSLGILLLSRSMREDSPASWELGEWLYSLEGRILTLKLFPIVKYNLIADLFLVWFLPLLLIL